MQRLKHYWLATQLVKSLSFIMAFIALIILRERENHHCQSPSHRPRPDTSQVRRLPRSVIMDVHRYRRGKLKPTWARARWLRNLRIFCLQWLVHWVYIQVEQSMMCVLRKNQFHQFLTNGRIFFCLPAILWHPFSENKIGKACSSFACAKSNPSFLKPSGCSLQILGMFDQLLVSSASFLRECEFHSQCARVLWIPHRQACLQVSKLMGSLLPLQIRQAFSQDELLRPFEQLCLLEKLPKVWLVGRLENKYFSSKVWLVSIRLLHLVELGSDFLL